MRSRSHKRKPLERRAWLLDHLRGRKYGCVMSDIWEGGARIELPLGVDVPQMFVLTLTESGQVRRYCEVRWRRAGAIGVKFTNPDDLSRRHEALGEPGSSVEWV